MSEVVRDAAIAAVGAGFVFLGRVLDRTFGWKRSREDFATKLRDELHQETQALKREIEDLRREVDAWREKYHTEKEANGQLRNSYAALQKDHATLRQDFDELMKKLVSAGLAP